MRNLFCRTLFAAHRFITSYYSITILDWQAYRNTFRHISKCEKNQRRTIFLFKATVRPYAADTLISALQFFLKFFDGKAFVIMAVMMSGGIGLRVSGLVPERFIAVFYTGLGASLLLAGLLFGHNFGKTVSANVKSV